MNVWRVCGNQIDVNSLKVNVKQIAVLGASVLPLVRLFLNGGHRLDFGGASLSRALVIIRMNYPATSGEVIYPNGLKAESVKDNLASQPTINPSAENSA